MFMNICMILEYMNWTFVHLLKKNERKYEIPFDSNKTLIHLIHNGIDAIVNSKASSSAFDWY